MRAVSIIAIALLVIGGLNWGLVGLFQFDLVAALFGGQGSAPARIVYVLVGVAGILGIGSLVREARGSSTHHV